MDQPVFLIFVIRDIKTFQTPFTMMQHIRWNAEKFIGTQYVNVLSPTLVNYDDQEERVAQLEESFKQNRKFIKTTAQKFIKKK